jgi:hypothetical protein
MNELKSRVHVVDRVRCSGQPHKIPVVIQTEATIDWSVAVMELMWAAMATSMVATAATLQTHHGRAAQSEAAGSPRPTTTTRACPTETTAWPIESVHGACCMSLQFRN